MARTKISRRRTRKANAKFPLTNNASASTTDKMVLPDVPDGRDGSKTEGNKFNLFDLEQVYKQDGPFELILDKWEYVRTRFLEVEGSFDATHNKSKFLKKRFQPIQKVHLDTFMVPKFSNKWFHVYRYVSDETVSIEICEQLGINESSPICRKTIAKNMDYMWEILYQNIFHPAETQVSHFFSTYPGYVQTILNQNLEKYIAVEEDKLRPFGYIGKEKLESINKELEKAKKLEQKEIEKIQ